MSWTDFLANGGKVDLQPSAKRVPLSGDVAERARKYIATMPPAISGSGGHTATFNVARKLADFGLSESEIFSMLRDDYNPRCQPPWSDRDLQHKASEAFHKREPRPLEDRPRAANDDSPPPSDDWQPSDADAPDAPPAAEAAPKTAPPTAWPVLDVSAIFEPLPPLNYLVESLDLCVGPPMLFAGYGFSGKTIAAQSMALSIATGERVWGAFSARQGRVIHIDYEQGPWLTRNRYQLWVYLYSGLFTRHHRGN